MPDPLETTTAEKCRDRVLWAIEQAANKSLIEEGERPAGWGDLALKLAQAYLLLDPLVDAQGVPVAGQQFAQQAMQAATAPPAQPQDGKAHGTVKKGPDVGQHRQPPHVAPGKAADALEQMHQRAEQVLRGSNPSRPTPRPRVGA